MPAFQVKEENDDFGGSVPEDAILRVRLESTEVRTIEYTDKNTGEPKSFQKIRWRFKIVDERPAYDKFYDRTVFGETFARLTTRPDDKFRNWAEALLRRPLDAGSLIELDDLTGLAALASFTKEQDYKDKSKYWDRVDELLPLTDQMTPPF